MNKRLTKKQMWIFAIGQLGWSILGGIINAWLVSFYLIGSDVQEKGTPNLIPSGLIIGGFLTVLGLITALCRIWDAVTDPMVANLSDNSRNPRGRRLPFMQKAAIPFAITTVLVFMAPVNKVSGINIAWIAVTLVLFYTFMTIYCTPYNALISEFGKTQEDRMNISTYISLTYFAGTLLAYTPFVFGGLLENAVGYYNAYRICFTVLSVIALFCMLLPTFKLKETDFIEVKPANSNAFASLGKTFKNNNFKIFALSDIMYWVGITLFQTGLPFFVKYSMKLDSSFTMYFMGAMTVLSACFYPVVSKLVEKFGKKKLTIVGFIGLSIAYILTAICSGSNLENSSALGYVYGIAVVVVASFPMALLGIIPQSIVADVAEEDSIVSGEKREGMFFAARTFAMKFGQSLALLAFTSLAIIGSDRTEEMLKSNDITPSTEGLMIVGIVAFAFCIIGAIILCFYNEKAVMNTINQNKKETI